MGEEEGGFTVVAVGAEREMRGAGGYKRSTTMRWLGSKRITLWSVKPRQFPASKQSFSLKL